MKHYRFMVDIEVYDEASEKTWHQAKYLFHGFDDLMWTDDVSQGLDFLREQILAGEIYDERD